jgi:signal transduction histidine kinase
MGKRNKLDELILENQELASKILVAHQEMIDELINSKKEFFIQNAEKKKQVANLINANKAMSDELSLAYQELAFQNIENEKRAAELVVANDKLAFQNVEKEKRAAELVVANDKLAFQNVEKEKRAAELVIANDELAFQNVEKEKRAADLVIINKELEQFVYANKELKQFAYIASHELKEPIRTIANFIQIISEDYSAQLDEKAIEYLRIINDSTKRMTILINSLLHFSRLGVDKKLSYVDCKEIIDSVISDLTDIIKSSDATIEVSEMPKLNVYEIEFRQIFQNLITNAIKFQKKGSHPEIQIRSEEINENFRFSVSDNGIGIDPTYFDRVFDIFQRLHNTEEVFEGKGIGLAYCKKIVQLHQGEIWIESELGKGSTFYFTIFKTLTV